MAYAVTFQEWDQANINERQEMLNNGAYMVPSEVLKLAQAQYERGEITEDQLADEIAFYAHSYP